MRRLVASSFVTLDCVIQARGGPEEDPAITALEAEEGPQLEVLGSPGLIQTLLAHDLVDEFAMFVYPVVVGSGKRLFGGGTVGGALRLTDIKVSPPGVIIATYERAGELQSGSFAFDEPSEEEFTRRERIAQGRRLTDCGSHRTITINDQQ